MTVLALAGLVLTSPPERAATPIRPPERKMSQLAEEAQVWVRALDGAKAANMARVISNDGKPETLDSLRAYLGSYIPLAKVKRLEIGVDRDFLIEFSSRHIIDVPLEKEPGFIRVFFETSPIRGELLDGSLLRSGKPVRILAFKAPHDISIDRLDTRKRSTIPILGRILGLLPHIICFVLLEGDDGLVRVAPQLDGVGMSENGKLIRDLLKVDDLLIPESAEAARR